MSHKKIRPPAGVSGGAGPMVSERVVARLLVVLAAAAGCLDAVCVTRLGGAFASVVTGNLVQLGRGVATLDGALSAGVTTAVAGYALGVAAGSAGLGSGAGWRRRACLIAVAELALLACVCAGWLAIDGQPNTNAAVLLLAPASAAMGVQSALTISSGVPGASTTYLTGTLTGLMRTRTGTPRRRAAVAGDVGRLAALLCGAIIGALLLRVAPLWAPALPVLLVGVVVAIIAISTRGRIDRP
ncbi:uncharacterized membrane protein YoaK (UPF0700 family) [Nonomuraea polychroma]|uniref:Uncharacterized membrane protein YoaK (UPF0700 family) n=1 Tax=Nonomuraea polychroma TaxID=46176 RepID=A0A438MIX9_9ACTN|nr:YoaK family protein [Nonomuraea polychroma]RVX45506.1 uncharacterized membrane protein YoaK (UPF0700 family) [Nonomuraea polychroma]